MEATLKIYGDIGEVNAMDLTMKVENTFSAKMLSEFLDENKEASSLLVKINSRGGDVQEGWAIYDMLKNSGKTIKTLGEGKIYSIATIIFLAGDEREIMENADGQIHNPYIPEYTLAGQYEANDLEKIARTLHQEESKILDFYVKKTGTEESTLAGYMKEDTKLSSKDMLNLGFATKIVEPVKAYAYMKPSKINITMDSKEFKSFGEKFDALAAKVEKFVGRSRVDPVALTLKDKEGNEFKLEKEEGSPEVGDKASPDGTYVMESGKTIVITEGSISEIKDAEPDDTEMDKANAKIVQMQKDLDALKAEKEVLEAAKVTNDAKEEELNTVLAEVKALKNDWKPEGRSKTSSAEKVDGVDIEKVKGILTEKKLKK